MKTVISFFLIGGLIFNQLTIGQTTSEHLIRIKSDFSNSKPVKMSELFSEIRYLPLETNPNCLLGYMGIDSFGKDIIISAHDESGSIFRFSDTGQFLNKIGNLGRGPQEYLDHGAVVQIGDTVFVVSNFSNHIVCYSLDGTFLKKYYINNPGRPLSLVKVNNNTFMLSLHIINETGRILKTDRSFNIITGYLRNMPLRYSPLVQSFAKSANRIYYYYPVIDTIYDISKGFPEPAIVLDHGKYNKPPNFKSTHGDSSDDWKYPSITDCQVSEKYLKLTLQSPKLTDIIFYRFSDGRVFNLNNYINDLDYGLKEIPSYRGGYLTKDNCLIFTLMPSVILKRYNLMTDIEKQDSRSAKFVAIAPRLTQESNPVLMICKLK